MTILIYRQVSDTETQILNPDSKRVIFSIVKQRRLARNAIHTIYKNGNTPYASLRRGMGGKVCLLEKGTECGFRDFLKAKGFLADTRDRFVVNGETYQLRSSRISSALELVDPDQPEDTSPLAIFFLGPPGEIHLMDDSSKSKNALLFDDEATDLLAHALIAEMITRDNTVRYSLIAHTAGTAGPGGTGIEHSGRSL